MRALLGAIAIICGMLGGWRVFAKYGQFVVADLDNEGQPICIRGRIIHPFGPKELQFYFRAIDVSKEWGWYSNSVSAFADRSCLCLYEVRIEHRLPTADYSLELSEHDLYGEETDVSDETVIHGKIKRR